MAPTATAAIASVAPIAPAPSSLTPSLSIRSPATASASATATTTAAAVAIRCKRHRKRCKTVCEHGRRKTQCVNCFDLGVGGGSVCKHRRRKDGCRECRAANPVSSDLLFAARARKWLWNPPRPWEKATPAAKTADPRPSPEMPSNPVVGAPANGPLSPAAMMKGAISSTSGSISTSASTFAAAASSSCAAGSLPPLPSPTSSAPNTASDLSESPSVTPVFPFSQHDHQLLSHLRQLHFVRLQYVRSRIAATAAWSATLRASPAPITGYINSSAIGAAAAAAAITHPSQLFGSSHQSYAHSYPGQWLTAWPSHDPRLQVSSAYDTAAAAPSTAAAVAAHLSRSQATSPYNPAV